MSLTAFLPTGAPQILPFIGTPGAGTVGYALVWSESPQGFTLAPITVGPDQFTGVLPVAKAGTGTSAGSITGTGALTFTAGGTNQNVALVPSGTGRLGIGTNSPETVVDVRGNTRIAGVSGVVSSTNQYALSLQNNANQCWLEILNNGGVNKGAFFGMSNNDFHLWNYQGGNTVFYNGTTAQSASPRVTISGSGNLGIGTTSPTSALHVAGTTASTSTTTGAARIDGGLGVAGAINNGGSLVTSGAKINFAALPTSDTGLAVGDLWRDGNTVKVKI